MAIIGGGGSGAGGKGAGGSVTGGAGGGGKAGIGSAMGGGGGGGSARTDWATGGPEGGGGIGSITGGPGGGGGNIACSSMGDAALDGGASPLKEGSDEVGGPSGWSWGSCETKGVGSASAVTTVGFGGCVKARSGWRGFPIDLTTASMCSRVNSPLRKKSTMAGPNNAVLL